MSTGIRTMPAAQEPMPSPPSGEPSTVKVAVIVLNYRTERYTVQCLESLEAEAAALSGLSVIVVDNCSGDGSAEGIEAAIQARGWGRWARLVRTERNGGFAYGNNRGIEAAFAQGVADFVLLLNSDTVVRPGTIERAVAAALADPAIGVLSCRLANADGSVQNVARRFPTPLRVAVGLTGLPWKWRGLFGWADCDDPTWDRDREARDVDWVGGAFMLIRREVLERVGGLDEGFFFYGEDIEFCHRVWRAGYRVRYEPVGTVTHFGGGSSDPERLAAAARNVHAWRGRYLVQHRCYGRGAATLARLLDAFAARVRLVLTYLRPSGPAKRPEFVATVRTLREHVPVTAAVPPPIVQLRLGQGMYP